MSSPWRTGALACPAFNPLAPKPWICIGYIDDAFAHRIASDVFALLSNAFITSHEAIERFVTPKWAASAQQSIDTVRRHALDPLHDDADPKLLVRRHQQVNVIGHHDRAMQPTRDAMVVQNRLHDDIAYSRR